MPLMLIFILKTYKSSKLQNLHLHSYYPHCLLNYPFLYTPLSTSISELVNCILYFRNSQMYFRIDTCISENANVLQIISIAFQKTTILLQNYVTYMDWKIYIFYRNSKVCTTNKVAAVSAVCCFYFCFFWTSEVSFFYLNCQLS